MPIANDGWSPSAGTGCATFVWPSTGIQSRGTRHALNRVSSTQLTAVSRGEPYERWHSPTCSGWSWPGPWSPWAAGSSLAALAEPAGSTPDLVFSVTEGVTYQATPKEIRDKFEPLAELLGAALKRNVRVVLVPAYDDVRAGPREAGIDLAFIHPAHVASAE